MDASRYGRLVTITGVAAIAIVFVGLRVALILVREPFFDELFTAWISQKSWSGILEVLRADSGPPLYYFAASAIVTDAAAIAQVFPIRYLSLLFGAATLASVLGWKTLGPPRFVAGVLLAMLPANLYFSTEARPYALCALMLGLATLLLDSPVPRRLWSASALVVLAAYTHYYAVLFFPVPLLAALVLRDRRQIRVAAFATGAMAVAFVPGFLLAAAQPAAAIEWMRRRGPAEIALSAVQHFGFAAPFPSRFLASPPLSLRWISALLVLVVLGWGLRKSPRARVFTVAAVVPVVGAMAFAVLGRPVYFPMRFESVLAVPIVLAIAFSMGELPPRVRSVVLAVFVAAGGFVCYRSVTDRALWRPDSYRETAEFARAEIGARDAILVASGPQYLELTAQRDARWPADIRPYPSSQGLHPGWRSVEGEKVLALDRDRLIAATGGSFVWAGDYGSPEMITLTRMLGSTVLLRREHVIVLQMSSDGMQNQQ